MKSTKRTKLKTENVFIVESTEALSEENEQIERHGTFKVFSGKYATL